ncbi:MAG: tRNA (adenosine(37)-N6)-dimethylallyltransferase MiaA [Candidatus Melainabacteria bacterium RIFOXYA12_FULL_32_12]|nr:MAG: tRNA (adenosine(37)-N6)-dimethylallyltransferase MiaA [Candidatus Melainabacteria bacterium RIFOXYA12_FULL_32_12]
MRNTGKIIILVGPTASGKTDLAIRIAQALDGEIISADSRIVYKGFDIGTAKPTAEEMAFVPHYMVDVADPGETYTVGKYKKEVEKLIENIQSRGKVPIVAGGTGFYIKAVFEGLDIPDVEPDIEFREEMRQLVQDKGKEFLYEKLKESDPKLALKLYPNDSFRIIRALEVQKTIGKPMSEVQALSNSQYNTMYVGLNAENRDFLYERINKRAHIMYENGLIDETKYLINKYGKTLSLLKTLGYKEVCEYLDNMCSLDESIQETQKTTRNYAKRQLTWFRANKKIQWYFIDKMACNEICEAVIKVIKSPNLSHRLKP